MIRFNVSLLPSFWCPGHRTTHTVFSTYRTSRGKTNLKRKFIARCQLFQKLSSHLTHSCKSCHWVVVHVLICMLKLSQALGDQAPWLVLSGPPLWGTIFAFDPTCPSLVVKGLLNTYCLSANPNSLFCRPLHQLSRPSHTYFHLPCSSAIT